MGVWSQLLLILGPFPEGLSLLPSFLGDGVFCARPAGKGLRSSWDLCIPAPDSVPNAALSQLWCPKGTWHRISYTNPMCAPHSSFGKRPLAQGGFQAHRDKNTLQERRALAKTARRSEYDSERTPTLHGSSSSGQECRSKHTNKVNPPVSDKRTGTDISNQFEIWVGRNLFPTGFRRLVVQPLKV